MKRSSAAILAAVIGLAGCGSSVTPTSSSTTVHTGITGNWQLALTRSDSPGSVGATYGVYLTQTGSAVSGIIGMQQFYPQCVLPSGPPCYFPFGAIDLELVGTVDAKGNMVLNTVSNTGGGGALSITASTTTDDAAFSGNYSITLVTKTGTWTNQGTISGNTIDTLNGTYSGTVKSLETGNTIGVTTTLSQTSSPDSGGDLEVSGSANFTGSSCFTSATVSSPGSLLGNQLVVNLVPTNSPTTAITLSGTLSQDAKTIAVDYSYVATNACVGDYGGGTLTLQ